MELIHPHSKYIASFLEMAEDLLQAGHWYAEKPDHLKENFSDYLKKFENERSGINLGPEEVQSTEFWMLENEIVVGRIRLNHTLNDSLKIRGGHIGYGVHSQFKGRGFATQALGLALGIAKQLGLHEILMTCDQNNTASIRVIEKNGGKYIDQIMVPGRNLFTRRYKILLKQP